MFKERLKKFIGHENIYYLRSFFPSVDEKNAFEIRRDFLKKFVNSGDLCFDIGANLGNRVEPLLAIGAQVVAVEPQDMCYKYLKKKFGSKIILVKKGVGATNENKTLHISSSHTISSFSVDWIDRMKEGRFREESWSETQVMEMTTLDDLINLYGTPQFVKIDVEGYEPEVLRGLSISVPMISFEYSVPEQTKNSMECINRLNNINTNYLFNYSTGDGLRWDLEQWIPAQELINQFTDPNYFKDKDAGDIYAKLPN